DMRVITVVMGAETTKERNAAISQMLDYAFNHFETKRLFDKGDTITNLQLLKAENKNIEIVASESISTIHPKGDSTDDITTDVEFDQNITVPLKQGEKVGTLYIKKDNEVLSESGLTVDQDIDKASYYTFFKRSMQKLLKAE